MYFTDRGIEELDARRGEETVTLGWVAAKLREFTDEHPDFEVAVERLATWLARSDDDAEDGADDGADDDGHGDTDDGTGGAGG